MLKLDKEDFMALVSGETDRVASAINSFNLRERGHFEDHPLSAKLVKQHLDDLIVLWTSNPFQGSRDWVFLFIADAQVADIRAKQIIASALSDKDCSYLPTVLYTMSTAPNLFEDCGEQMIELSSHPDREVRWRVAYFISKVKNKSETMLRAINILKSDRDDTTQVYVRACGV